MPGERSEGGGCCFPFCLCAPHDGSASDQALARFGGRRVYPPSCVNGCPRCAGRSHCRWPLSFFCRAQAPGETSSGTQAAPSSSAPAQGHHDQVLRETCKGAAPRALPSLRTCPRDPHGPAPQVPFYQSLYFLTSLQKIQSITS